MERVGLYRKYTDKIMPLLENGYELVNEESLPFEYVQEQMEVEIDRLTEGKLISHLKRFEMEIEDYADELEFLEAVMTEYAKRKAKVDSEVKIYFKFIN